MTVATTSSSCAPTLHSETSTRESADTARGGRRTTHLPAPLWRRLTCRSIGAGNADTGRGLSTSENMAFLVLTAGAILRYVARRLNVGT